MGIVHSAQSPTTSFVPSRCSQENLRGRLLPKCVQHSQALLQRVQLSDRALSKTVLQRQQWQQQSRHRRRRQQQLRQHQQQLQQERQQHPQPQSKLVALHQSLRNCLPTERRNKRHRQQVLLQDGPSCRSPPAPASSSASE